MFSLDWSKRSTDLTNIVVSVRVSSLSLRNGYFLVFLGDHSVNRDSRIIRGKVSCDLSVVRVFRRYYSYRVVESNGGVRLQSELV